MWGTHGAPFGERPTSEAERNPEKPGEVPKDARNAEILWVSWSDFEVFKVSFPRRLAHGWPRKMKHFLLHV